jgi:hypothetical protein
MGSSFRGQKERFGEERRRGRVVTKPISEELPRYEISHLSAVDPESGVAPMRTTRQWNVENVFPRTKSGKSGSEGEIGCSMKTKGRLEKAQFLFCLKSKIFSVHISLFRRYIVHWKAFSVDTLTMAARFNFSP